MSKDIQNPFDRPLGSFDSLPPEPIWSRIIIGVLLFLLFGGGIALVVLLFCGAARL